MSETGDATLPPPAGWTSELLEWLQADNDWTDPAAVDGHAYAGYAYDFYFKRFGRRGLDGNDLKVRTIVHPVRLEDYARYPPDGSNALLNRLWRYP